jgi:hypothetical protein
MNYFDTDGSQKEIEDKVLDMETALAGVCLMMGFILKDKMLEKQKENPDFNKIKALESQFHSYYKEREEIYSGNKEIIQKVINIYAPIIRSRLENE